jgi:hypothetical protein
VTLYSLEYPAVWLLEGGSRVVFSELGNGVLSLDCSQLLQDNLARRKSVETRQEQLAEAITLRARRSVSSRTQPGPRIHPRQKRAHACIGGIVFGRIVVRRGEGARQRRR